MNTGDALQIVKLQKFKIAEHSWEERHAFHCKKNTYNQQRIEDQEAQRISVH